MSSVRRGSRITHIDDAGNKTNIALVDVYIALVDVCIAPVDAHLDRCSDKCKPRHTRLLPCTAPSTTTPTTAPREAPRG